MATLQSSQSILFKSGFPEGNRRRAGFQAPHNTAMTLAIG
jgi:hypothetical protein